MEFNLLWCDEAVLAVDKPAGLLTIRDGYDPSLPYLAGLLSTEYGKVWVVHRLDKDTSGVILFARTAEAHRILNAQFALRETEKVYYAIVVGEPAWDETTIRKPLKVNGDRRHRTVIDERKGKSAETAVKVLERFSGLALVEATPHTGYTHQIRAHLAAVGLPLLCDPLYQSLLPAPSSATTAAVIARLPIRRTALHALRLRFCHPMSNEYQEVRAALPIDFADTLKIIRK